MLLLNGVSRSAVVFALKRPQFGAPDPTPRLRDVEKPQERFGMNVLPMENVFTSLSFSGGNAAVKTLYAQLTPPDRLLHARSEARIFDAQAMDHPLFGHPGGVTGPWAKKPFVPAAPPAGGHGADHGGWRGESDGVGARRDRPPLRADQAARGQLDPAA